MKIRNPEILDQWENVKEKFREKFSMSEAAYYAWIERLEVGHWDDHLWFPQMPLFMT